jgi:hypothetical protein
MLSEQDAKRILSTQFPAIHLTAVLSHYEEAIKKYRAGDWEGSMLKGGKFLEAVLKALLTYCRLPVPAARRFKVGDAVRDLGKTTSYDDSIRLLIPRACTFIYDIVSNRGTRHDPDKVNPNKMDASVAMPVISWVLAEMIRFASGIATPTETLEQVENLTEKKYPHIENIGGRLYVNISGLSARDLGLFLLHAHYPQRIRRADLSASMQRHGVRTAGARSMALLRLKNVVDETEEGWILRASGREEAENLLSAHS